MDGYHSPTAVIESAWEELESSDADRRYHCFDVIDDVLETGRLEQSDAELTVERLVTFALSDECSPERESALFAACTASAYYEIPYRLVAPLAARVDGFEPALLLHVLSILGWTHDQAALPVVERFLHHHHPEVRGEAKEAMTELRRRGEPVQDERA